MIKTVGGKDNLSSTGGEIISGDGGSYTVHPYNLSNELESINFLKFCLLDLIRFFLVHSNAIFLSSL